MLPAEPNKEYTVRGLKVKTIPAYNTNKDFHRKDTDWVGYIVTINGRDVYHAGDTDATPEMEALIDIDIAFIPVSGTYVMTAEESAAAVNKFKPEIVIAMHYNAGIVGSKGDAEKFKSLVRESEVILLD